RLDGAVAELGEVVDGVQAGPLVGEVGVQVVLYSVQRDGGAGEGEPLAVLRIGDAGHEDGVLRDPVGGHAALDQVDVQVHEPAHLDPAAERNFPVPLGEVGGRHGTGAPL